MTKNHELQVVRKSLCNSYIASVLIPSFDLYADDLESEFQIKKNKTKNQKVTFWELCVLSLQENAQNRVTSAESNFAS